MIMVGTYLVVQMFYADVLGLGRLFLPTLPLRLSALSVQYGIVLLRMLV
jgi:hypothetical protein